MSERINLNDYVWVRPTEKGWECFYAYHRDLIVGPERYREMADVGDGWYRFHLWEVAHIFGPVMFMGAEACFERNEVHTMDPTGEVTA